MASPSANGSSVNDFSPTGYWAIYSNHGGGMKPYPVVCFLDNMAMVCSADGLLVRAPDWEGEGQFLAVTPNSALTP